jgi:hypothetical protein
MCTPAWAPLARVEGEYSVMAAFRPKLSLAEPQEIQRLHKFKSRQKPEK